ncbi:MAG TPA: hypothetical protein VG897_15905, partial [Terriglobales bacterium]|nr:hypothetical protein [Terriglobales bacterium]
GTAVADNHDKDFRHHEIRKHEARRAAEHRQHERREWAREHHDNGKHVGWEKGRNNPHHATYHHAPGPRPHPGPVAHANGPHPHGPVHPMPAQGK